jgi:hypothetical protein
LISILDNRIRQLGRWNALNGGIWSGWGGSQLKFTISGSLTLKVNADVMRPAGAVTYCECVIDNSPENSILKSFVNGQVTFDIPDINEHSIVIKTNGFRADIFNQLSRSILQTIEIDGELIADEPKPLLLQCVGDSWMASHNDWPRLIREDMFDTYQVATGGMTCQNMNTDYNFNANGISANDPLADAVILSFGVNDFNANISVASFQASLYALVDKVKANQSCPLFLIQVPSNLSTNKAFGQYGNAMQVVANNRANVTYITTSSINVTWQADQFHIDANGKTILANYIGQQLIDNLNIKRDFMRINGKSFIGENVITNKHAFRYRGSFDFGSEIKLADENSIFKIKSNLYTLE